MCAEKVTAAGDDRRDEDPRSFLAAVVKSSDDAIIGLDPEGVILSWNGSANRVFGYAPGEAIGRPVTILAASDAAEEFAGILAAVRGGGRVRRDPTRLARKDGGRVDVSVSFAPVRDDSGQFVGVAGIAREKSPDGALMDSLASEIAVLDGSGVIIATNRAWRAFSERNRAAGPVSEGADYLGVCDRAAGQGEESAAAVAAGIRDVLSGYLEAFEAEYPCDSPTERRDFSMRVTPLHGGASGRAVVCHENISERRAAAEALKESERRFRMLLENCRDVIYQLDLSTRTVEYVSPSSFDVFGIPPEELIAGGLARMLPQVHPDDVEWFQGHLESLDDLTPGVDVASALEYRYRHPDKGWRWLSRSGAVICGGDHRPQTFVGNSRDVTEKKTAEERLRDLPRRLVRAEEDERRRISQELHDEIGQALSALKIHLQWMGQDADDPAKVGSRAGECVGLIERLLRQVRSLSRDLRPLLLDDLGLVAALRSLVSGQARIGGFEALVEVTAEDPDFRLDTEIETACYRVAQEALTNVVRHAGAKHVGIELRLDRDALRLTVEDDGIGFDPAAAWSQAAGGASLGLLGMQERVTLLGGRFAVRSEPDRGTEVSAEYPIGPRDDLQAGSPPR